MSLFVSICCQLCHVDTSHILQGLGVNPLFSFLAGLFICLGVNSLFFSLAGLFVYDETTQQHWINPNSLENDGEYQLIGLLLGLAIYNNIILDVRFPMVLYRKLLGCPVDFSDLYTSHPVSNSSMMTVLS